jgi:hypothetical protein
MNGLSAVERGAIEGCVKDSAAEPNFESIRYCLIWPDEQVRSLCGDAYELLGDLWIVRGFIHRGVPLDDWSPDGGHYLISVWNECLMGGLRWIGFERLVLTRAERLYLQQHLQPGDLEL